MLLCRIKRTCSSTLPALTWERTSFQPVWRSSGERWELDQPSLLVYSWAQYQNLQWSNLLFLPERLDLDCQLLQCDDHFQVLCLRSFFNLSTLVHLDSMLFRLKSTQLPCCSTCRPSRGTRRRGGSPSSSSCRRGERWASSLSRSWSSWSSSLSLTLLLAGGGAEDHRSRTSSGEKSCCCRRESTGGETSGWAGDRQELAGEEGEEGRGGGRGQGGLEREGGRIVIILEISHFHRNSSSNRIRPNTASF